MRVEVSKQIMFRGDWRNPGEVLESNEPSEVQTLTGYVNSGKAVSKDKVVTTAAPAVPRRTTTARPQQKVVVAEEEAAKPRPRLKGAYNRRDLRAEK